MAKLGDICTNQSSNIKQSDLENNNGSYPIYGASGLIKNVDFYKQEKPYVAIVKDGAGVGRVMQLPAYSSVIGTMQYIIPNDDTDVKYLAYAMEHMNLAKYYSGATIPHIYFKDYKNEYIKGHNIETQKKIATTLDKVTHTIDTCNAILEKLDLLVKSRFVEMFGDTYSNSMNWKRMTFRQVAVRLSDGPFGSNLKSEHYSESGIRVIRLGNIGIGEFIDKDKSYIPNEHYEKLKKYTCRTGEIVIGTLGEPNLRACRIPDFIDIAVNKADCVHFIPDENKLNVVFACQYINCPETLLLASSMVHGQTRTRISSGQIAELPIYLPPLSLQEQFAAFVEQTDKSKLAVKQVLEKAETLKKALMQEYFG